MSVEACKLEKIGLEYAREAVELDRKGLRTLAAGKYQKAVDALAEIVHQYPDTPLAQIYMKKIREYRSRIQFLRGMMAEDAKSGAGYFFRGPPPETHASTTQDVEKTSTITFKSQKTGLRWSDTVDLEEVKRVLQQSIIYPTMRPDLFPLGWPRGILLYGPPGCGKTTIAAAVSTEINGYFYAVDAASVMSKWLGEAEKNVASLFGKLRALAAQDKPTILFIDEVDSLLGIRQQEVGGEVRVRNQFLKEMDGLADKMNTKLLLYVIASTNKPWALDWGFIRRFQRRIYFPMPDQSVRMDFFRFFLNGITKSSGVDYNVLASLTEDYSPSDIKDICQTAVIEVVTELFESGKAVDYSSKPRPVDMDDLKDAIRRIRPSMGKEIKRVYEAWAQRFRAF